MPTTAATRKKIIALYGKGLRLSDIAAEVGVSREWVRQVMTDQPNYVPKVVAVAVRREKVAKLHESGEEPAAISKKLSVPVSTVRRDLTVMDLWGAHQLKIDARRKSVRELLATNISLREISEQLSVDPTTVSHDVKVMGLQRRPRGTVQEVATRRQKVAKLWKAHHTMREISEQLGVPMSTIQGDVLDLPRRHERLVSKARR